MDLFEYSSQSSNEASAPLASRMRPKDLSEFFGQEEVIGKGRALRKLIEGGAMPSLILWGPPGSGKTTLAGIIAKTTSSFFCSVSAVSAGVADLRSAVKEAKEHRRLQGQKTILFIDEIHRFNKAQQDAILPYVEDGTVTLIGATTENPSFEVNTPLLSRLRVFVLKALGSKEIEAIVLRALADKERGIAALKPVLKKDALEHIVNVSGGDARTALNILEMAVTATSVEKTGERVITLQMAEDAAQKRFLDYDKSGDQHYDIISALHKTMRGSDPDAALYWLGRMLEAGEDPLYIMRRVVRFASEDIGMADPQALVVSVSAQQAVHFIGMPEAALALAQAVVYCATAPKSNALYTGYKKVQKVISEKPAEKVPLHLRNAPTALMKNMGYGKGYKYAHDYEGAFVKQQNLPKSLEAEKFYEPKGQGYEGEILKRLGSWHGKARGKNKE